MTRSHSLADPLKPFCWECGELYKGQNDWVQCHGCETWECKSCAESILAFFVSYCSSCEQEYCNICSKEIKGDKYGFKEREGDKYICPDCGKAGEIIYAYASYYEHDKSFFIKGKWTKREEVPPYLYDRLKDW